MAICISAVAGTVRYRSVLTLTVTIRQATAKSSTTDSGEEAVMGKPDVQTKIEEYPAEPMPPEAVADLRDLGVIGYANELSGVTPAIMHDLIAARANGRTWQEIGNRLDMTGEVAEESFKKLSDSYWVKPAPRWQKRLAGLIRAITDPSATSPTIWHATVSAVRPPISLC
jgi:hypothetical protein